MNDAFRVREVERVADLRDDFGDLFERERTSLRQDFFQVLSLDVLHGDEHHAVRFVLPDVVHGHDRGVIEDAGGLRLAEKPLLKFFGLVVVGMRRGTNRLQRDETSDEGIFREIHDPHSSLTELADHFISAELQLGRISGRFAMASLRTSIDDNAPVLCRHGAASPTLRRAF